MPYIKKEVCRLNVNVNPEIKKKLDDYANSHYMTQAAATNMILTQFFDGQEALQNMGNLSELMKIIAQKSGIDLNEVQGNSVSLSERG